MAMDDKGMSAVVKVVTCWLLGVVFVFGLAVALFGHVSPGGGFAGGVVLACGYVLATLAFGAAEPPAARFGRLSSVLDGTGALAFLVIAILGYHAGHFFQRWIEIGQPFTVGSTPFVVLANLAIFLKVGAGLFAGFLALAVFRPARASLGGGEP